METKCVETSMESLVHVTKLKVMLMECLDVEMVFMVVLMEYSAMETTCADTKTELAAEK